mmetsp:Transcript_58306/g.138969  ORF Transcript_58306/g.138969 Transcript_58306/m.138969 type:complete len:81 (+) Transcript_58306:3-245(+)
MTGAGQRILLMLRLARGSPPEEAETSTSTVLSPRRMPMRTLLPPAVLGDEHVVHRRLELSQLSSDKNDLVSRWHPELPCT